MLRPGIQVAFVFVQIALFAVFSVADEKQGASSAKSVSAKDVAYEVDRQILAELQKAGVTVAERCSDEDFLRRVSLDISGQLPSPSDVIAFRQNNDPDKRAALIEKLVDSSEFGLNWARYWRDVIYFRATEQRSRFNQEEFTAWMAEQWNKGAGWNSTVTAMLTASGNVEEHPETALIFAQGAIAEEVASEACRVFLGIQLQCANCHDHPSDVWKREQFHQLAAYFPRMAERRTMKGTPEYEIVSVNTETKQGDFMREQPEMFIRAFDRDNDLKLSKKELEAGPKRTGRRIAARMKNAKNEEMQNEEMQKEGMNDEKMGAGRLPAKAIDRLFAFGDANKDDLLTVEELKAAQPPVNRRRGSTEHHMIDLKNPTSLGTVVDPKFFVGGEALPHGLSDEDRRVAVAKSFTSPENPWFARAIVNRVWAEMLGEGFYMPVDDMGPTREARYPAVLELLCQNFVANGLNPKWLVRTIASTETYQRKIQSRPASEDELPFASATPVPLRSDVVFNSLAQVFGVTDGEMNGRTIKGVDKKEMKDKPRAFLQSPRFLFDTLFGIDPSIPKDDVTGTIPQSLMMMNSRVFRARMSAKGNTELARILGEHKDNRDALREIYLLVLAREPSLEEMKICADYISDVKDRPEAFEDMMWSLLNSSEFISRR
ncbi:MAG: DUF1549 domain-containing protein [Schlesneria sp.]